MRPKNPATTVITIKTIQSNAYEASSLTVKLLPLDEPPEWAILWYSDMRRHPARMMIKEKEPNKKKRGGGDRDRYYLRQASRQAHDGLGACQVAEGGWLANMSSDNTADGLDRTRRGEAKLRNRKVSVRHFFCFHGQIS